MVFPVVFVIPGRRSALDPESRDDKGNEIPGSRFARPGMTAEGVLKRRCAIGKTPLTAVGLCKPALLCHNAFLPECLPCQSPTDRSLTRIPRG
jgi:hypothetical protein